MCHLLKCGSSNTRRLLNWQGPWLWTHWRLFKSHHLDWQIKGISHQLLQILFTRSIRQKPTRQRCDKNLWSGLRRDWLSSESLLLFFSSSSFLPNRCLTGWYLGNRSVSKTFRKQTLMLTAWRGMFSNTSFFCSFGPENYWKNICSVANAHFHTAVYLISSQRCELEQSDKILLISHDGTKYYPSKRKCEKQIPMSHQCSSANWLNGLSLPPSKRWLAVPRTFVMMQNGWRSWLDGRPQYSERRYNLFCGCACHSAAPGVFPFDMHDNSYHRTVNACSLSDAELVYLPQDGGGRGLRVCFDSCFKT